MQNKVNELHGPKVALKLMSDDQIDEEIFVALLDFSKKMLTNGNHEVQQTYYKQFTTENDSEIFFEWMNKILDDEIEIL